MADPCMSLSLVLPATARRRIDRVTSRDLSQPSGYNVDSHKWKMLHSRWLHDMKCQAVKQRDIVHFI